MSGPAESDAKVVELPDLLGATDGVSPELRRAIALMRHAHAEPPDWLLGAILDRLDAAERAFLPHIGRLAAYAGGFAAGAAGALVIANRARIRELIS